MTNQPTIGFIGLGAMGAPMATRLAGAGYALLIQDAVAARAADIAQATGSAVATTAEMAQRADIIITMLPTSKHVQSVLEGPAGLLAVLRPNTLIIDMSSGAPELTKMLGSAVHAARGHLIDAPVSGGVARARTGDLAIMVGGDDAAIDRARPVLSAMGSSILPTGPLGTAHAMKALNNLVSATTFLITVEALSIGKQAGLDPARMVDILNVSTGMSNSSQKKMHQFVLPGRYESGFGLDLMVKDLTIALGLAQGLGVPAPLSALCREMWQSGAAALGPGQDHTALAKLVERLSGIKLA